jgi:two-component system response regulator RstA
MSQPSILIVEDDEPLAAVIADFLRQHGFVVAVEARGDRARARIVAEKPSLLVLDLMLPGMDGLEVCRSVRADYRGPILMLTGRGDEVDEIVGLELGADDYVAKPVRPRVLLARIRTLLRRPSATPPATGPGLRVGDVAIDPGARAARVRDTALPLTSGEFDLLFFLASRAGQVVDRRVMYQELRGAPYDELDRSVDLMVSRLRQKLQAACGVREVIKTVRGVGYLFMSM